MNTPARPELAEVRRSYQVADDVMIDYRPRVAGLVDIPFTDARRMTRTEGALLDTLTQRHGLLGLRNFAGLADQAFAEAERRYPDQPVPAGIPGDRQREWQGNDGHRDAFRHCYWNALMTKDYGRGWTSAFATAHEGVPGNWANREAMDLYNNAVGRQIAADHPNATREQLAGHVAQAVRDGRLVVLDAGGQLAWSDGVRIGRHGLSPDDVIGPRLPTPGTQSSAAPHRRDGEAVAAMVAHPMYAQAAGALDAQGMNPLGAHVVFNGAMQAGLANVHRVSLGNEVIGADGMPTRHVFALGDRLPGTAGRDYAMVTQRDLETVQPGDAARAGLVAEQARAATLAQDRTQAPRAMGV